ncbi:Flp pilus assembly protein CpaB [Paenibacillus macerans]|uniref:Flp pilus assembly protein CpaB n=1 Tax=Paenibacillus macerans TaxID=44252 RepID=A0A090ZPP4_PAEMA|nr:Flp pilus assembly protein CpaB [Paenibacillus macerans]KFN12240.1 Flp pilus assembly protein CpaB [Paenibacillus macerans]MCY7558485.1 Flp pilus assembly protein CpaB [Paenibacillus macerans]MEC0150251.1 Flp pilus assembly protein CpaB [Paenibacillus macerans]UMV45342.1 Flp pilus assembly protein CpaB [Paenibacillus macerans]SUA84406.1 Flp pilus assembly protein CpaB [Paenibacillus macerans]
MNWFKNRSILGACCIILSLILCLGIAPLLNRSASKTVAIVRVIEDVDKGIPIKSEQLETVEVGAFHLPQEVLKSVDDVVGKYAATDLKKGDYLLPSKLSAVPLDAYLTRLDGQKQALSVTIKSLAAGLSGKLQPGDIISLIAADYGELRTTTLPPELKYVEVLSVTTSSGLDAQTGNSGETPEDDRELPSTITLHVLPEQAVLLTDIETKGKLHAALVYRGDAKTSQMFIDKQDEYFTSKQANTEDLAHE